MNKELHFFKKDKTKTKFYFILRLYILSLIALFTTRIFLYLRYPEAFANLEFFELLQSFVMGSRIDIITLNTFVGIIILLFFLPFKFTLHKVFKITLSYIWLIILISILVVNIGDTLYFEYVGRHLSTEFISGGAGDFGFLINMIFIYYWLENLVAFILILALIYIWYKTIKYQIVQNDFLLRQSITFFIILFLLILGARSKIIDKPFGISDAFSVAKLSSGNLAISGFYSFYRSTNSHNTLHTFMNDNIAIQNTKKLLSSKNTTFIDDKYPLSRKFIAKQPAKHNVVIILLESWSSRYIDSFGNNNIKATPNFDKIASKSLQFTNAYANGQRSIYGITSMFCGLTVPIGTKPLGSGLELSQLTYIGKLAQQNGYSTISMQSSKRESFRVGSISHLAGFEQYYGSEDFDNLKDEQRDTPPSFGTWDGSMLRFLNDKLDNMQEPFLSFSFTASTHPMFVSAGTSWEKFKPHSQTTFKGFLNTLVYSDDMLGEFFKNASQKPWFDNTIFILLADHTYLFSAQSESEISDITTLKPKDKLERFKIPLLVYAPKIIKPKKVDYIVSQNDILPSLVDILGWSDSFTTISNSIFDKSVDNRFAFINASSVEYLITKDGFIAHTLKDIATTNNKNLEESLLSIDQSISTLLNNNHIHK